MSTVSNLKSQYDLGPEIQHFYEILNFGPFDVGHIIREVKGAAPHLALEQLLFSFWNSLTSLIPYPVLAGKNQIRKFAYIKASYLTS